MSGSEAVSTAGGFTDGEWHRLHPATPLLRGGIGLAAVLLWLAANLRERVVGWVFGYGDPGGDPLDELGRHQLFGVAALGVLAVLAVGVVLFWVSWRASAFRIDGDAVTVRHGVLLRTTRTAKLDRIQGVTVSRPLIPRLFGAARIELDVAGQNANVRLEYLSTAGAEQLRRDVLRLASGSRRAEAAAGVEAPETAILEETGPTIIAVTPVRAIGSALLSGTTLLLAAVVVLVVVLGGAGAGPVVAVSLFPFLIGSVTLTVRRAARTLRYSVVATPDGVRVASGLVSTQTEAVPPGRVHALQIDQPLLWRIPGWWRVAVNRAGHAAGRRDRAVERSLAPVATIAEVLALVPQLVPDLSEDRALLLAGLTGRGDEGGFTPAPRRARWLRPLSWRRTGFRTTRGSVLARAGFLRRELTIVPEARMQSVSLRQGLLERGLGVATVHPHVVPGPVATRLHLIDTGVAEALFTELAAAGVGARAADVSHRWAEPA